MTAISHRIGLTLQIALSWLIWLNRWFGENIRAMPARMLPLRAGALLGSWGFLAVLDALAQRRHEIDDIAGGLGFALGDGDGAALGLALHQFLQRHGVAVGIALRLKFGGLAADQ